MSKRVDVECQTVS